MCFSWCICYAKLTSCTSRCTLHHGCIIQYGILCSNSRTKFKTGIKLNYFKENYIFICVLFLLQFQLTPIVMCTIFVLSGATYAITAPFVGRLCDKYVSPRILTLAGCWLVLIGCLLVGPAPFTDLKP